MIIEDGKGKGYSAAVTPNGELRTIAPIVRPLHYYSSEFGKAFQLASGPIAVDTNTQFVLWGKNINPSSTFHVTEMHLHFDGGQTSHQDTLYYQIFVGTGTPSGGYIQPSGHSGNLNLASIVPPDLDLRLWDQATNNGITIPSDGDRFIYQIMGNGQSMHVENWEGGLLMPPNSVLALKMSTKSEVAEATVTIYGFYSNESEHG